MKYKNKPFQQGFTLIEIFIALLIGLFLTAGATQIFLGTKNNNRMQENLSRMQESARFAMHFLSQDLRQAAFDGGACGRGKMLNNAIKNVNLSGAVSPERYQFETRKNGSVELYSALSGAISGDVSGGDDIIRIRSLSNMGNGVSLKTDLSGASDNVDVSGAGGFSIGDMVLITDCKYSDIFIITGITGDELEHATGGVSGGVPAGNKTASLSFPGYKVATTKVYRLSSNSGSGQAAVSYNVSDSFGVPGLAKDGDQLVPNIENMQILYGQRTNSGDAYFVPADTLGLDMEEVISIRVSLLVQSPEDFVATSPQNFTFPPDASAATVPTDRRLRKIYTSTIAVRNRLN